VSWILAFAGFAVLIILHEFGHFVVAKWTGMRVERFFLFFPPKIWSVRRGETEYGIGAIPAGGFVKITGMNPDDLEPRPPAEEGDEREGETPNDLLNRIEAAGQDESEDRLPDGTVKPEIVARGYYNQPVWKRIAVISAGPIVNIIIAFVIFFGLAFSLEDPTGLEVGAIESDSPASTALQEDDLILSVDGVAPTNGGSRPDGEALGERADAFATAVNDRSCAGGLTDGCEASEPVTMVVERDGRRETLEVTPTYDADAPPIEEGAAEGRFRLGFAFRAGGEVPANLSTPEAAEWALDRMWFVTKETASIPAKIIDPEEREQIGSVVGGYETTRQAIDLDWELALGILGLISISLAIINLFPFLPLDGGHIFWSLVEKVRGRAVSFQTMERSGAIGFLLILMLFFIGLSNDIDRLTGEGFGVR
jgi:regulator of sigma E protease